MSEIGLDEVEALDQPACDPRVGESVVHPSTVAAHLYEVVRAELSQVLGYPRLGDLQRRAEGLHVVLAISELFDQADPVAMRDHPEQGGEFVDGEGAYGHGPIITINPQR